jgi:hypothetical protein
MVDAATASALARSHPPGTVGAVTASNTQLASSSTSPSMQGKSSAGAVVGGLLAVAAAAGIGIFGFTQITGAQQSDSVEPEPSQKAATVAPVEPEPKASPPAKSADVAPITEVSLRVETDPLGAILTKDGFQVCSETPCTVTASPNESLQLEASRGSQMGTAKVLAERDQTVKIKLEAPKVKQQRRPAAAAAPAANHAAPRMCEVEVDGLKILRACP